MVNSVSDNRTSAQGQALDLLPGLQVAVDALLLSTAESYRGAGVSNYSQNLLRALGQLVQEGASQAQVTAFLQDPAFQAPGVALERVNRLTRRPPGRILWEQAVLPRRLAQLGADVVHGLVNVLPLASQVPGVVTVHDLSFLRMPEKFPLAKRLYLARMCPASVAKARRVIAVSTQTADDLIHFFATEAEKIEIVYNGVEPRFRPTQPGRVEEFRRAKGLSARFFFYLGTLEPRKNLVRLVDAYAAWRQQARPSDRDVQLVIAGGKGWFYQAIFRRVRELGLTKWVRFPGFLPRAELPDWYRAAEVFVYPSLFEGFGLPVLEAMACGTPVICSRTPCLLEVVGDAALTFSAESTQELTQALDQVVGQSALQADLRRRGLAQAQKFSWERTARETMAVYRMAAR